MKLITKEIAKRTPEIGTNANKKPEDITIQFKLFCPWSSWNWYISEANFETGELFGYCVGFEKEWGYVDLNELLEIRGPGGLRIERDRFFDPVKFSELKV